MSYDREHHIAALVANHWNENVCDHGSVNDDTADDYLLWRRMMRDFLRLHPTTLTRGVDRESWGSA